jgi:hypothetical protein
LAVVGAVEATDELAEATVDVILVRLSGEVPEGTTGTFVSDAMVFETEIVLLATGVKLIDELAELVTGAVVPEDVIPIDVLPVVESVELGSS